MSALLALPMMFAPSLILAASELPPSPFDAPEATPLAVAERRLRGCVVAGPAQDDLLATARAARLRCAKVYDTVLAMRTQELATDDTAGRRAARIALDDQIVRLLSASTGLTH